MKAGIAKRMSKWQKQIGHRQNNWLLKAKRWVKKEQLKNESCNALKKD